MSVRPAPAIPPLGGVSLWLAACAAAAGRWAPHPWNFTPVGGFALFSGHAATGWQRYAAPLFAILLSDALIGFYHPLAMLAVYAGHAAAVEIGRRMLSGRRGNCPAGRVVAASALASCAFFALSNLASWWLLYSHDLAGLRACFVAALPFFQASLLGNALYGCAFVKGHEWLARRRLAPR